MSAGARAALAVALALASGGRARAQAADPYAEPGASPAPPPAAPAPAPVAPAPAPVAPAPAPVAPAPAPVAPAPPTAPAPPPVSDRWGLSSSPADPWYGQPPSARVTPGDVYDPWGIEPPETLAGEPRPPAADGGPRAAPRHGPERPLFGEPLVRGGIYDRPYLWRASGDAGAVAVGGYLDVVGAFEVEQGVEEGWSAEMRRFNLFVSSRVAEAVRMTSEIEIEHGTELALETAAVDILLHHAFAVRAGVLLVPIGKFNIAHDSPRYDVVDRPLVSTRILPATYSDVGAGVFGAFHPGGGHRLTYELYLVNGLGDGVIAAEGTRVPAGKSPAIFEGDNNGVPALAGRVAFLSSARRRVKAEIGFANYHGIYNRYREEGETVDDARWLHLLALDAEVVHDRLYGRGEVALAFVDTPPALTPLHARRQFGFYLESGLTLWQGRFGPLPRASLAAVARFDHIDLNLEDQQVGEGSMGEETTRLSLGVSFRPASPTSIRLVYHHDWLTDALDNALRAGGIQLGLATYF
jgi:hypothetical protein